MWRFYNRNVINMLGVQCCILTKCKREISKANASQVQPCMVPVASMFLK